MQRAVPAESDCGVSGASGISRNRPGSAASATALERASGFGAVTRRMTRMPTTAQTSPSTP
jgi:hypothetical protein